MAGLQTLQESYEHVLVSPLVFSPCTQPLTLSLPFPPEAFPSDFPPLQAKVAVSPLHFPFIQQVINTHILSTWCL